MRKILSHVKHHAHAWHAHAKKINVSKRKLFLWCFGVINIIFVLQILTVFVSPPQTKLGDTPVGLKTKKQIAKQLKVLEDSPIRLQINNRVYTYQYRDLGVYLDSELTLKNIFVKNTLPFPLNISSFLTALIVPHTIKPQLSFTQDFDEFVQKTIYDFSAGSDIMLFDQQEKRMTLYQQEERYGLHPSHFRIYITDTFGKSTDPLIPPLTPLATDAQNKVLETNTKITDVFSRPLTVIMRVNNADRFFTIDRKDLQKEVKADVATDSANARFIPSNTLLEKYANHVIFTEEGKLATSVQERLSIAIQRALHDRYVGFVGDSVHVNVDSGPNSDGSLAKRYIEIDISQQRMYTFKDGVLVKSYRVSTGKDYPTPTGTFEILNKTGLGFSTIYNVWMPYWMGFNYSKELHAYFGIHELPFYYSAGIKIQRPRDFIGVPNTGGCVALDVGDAKEVYKFADIGTKVVIYQ